MATAFEERCFYEEAVNKPPPALPRTQSFMCLIGLANHNDMSHVARFLLSCYPPGMRLTKVF